MSSEFAQMQALGSERGKDARHRDMQFRDRKLVQPGIHAVRLDAGDSQQRCNVQFSFLGRVSGAARCKLHDVLAAHQAINCWGV